MTYNEAKKICEQSDCDRLCIQVDSWIKGQREGSVEYSVWDGHTHFYGETLEIAVHGFMAAHPQEHGEPDGTAAAAFAEIGGAP